MTTKIAMLAIVLAVGITTANAQIVQTEKTQHERIREGVKSGELTKSEAANLHSNERQIHQETKNAKADGVVTRSERKDIRADQKRESRKIYRKKHNVRVRH